MSKKSSFIAMALCLAIVSAVPAMAQISGGIFTSAYENGSWRVNANVFTSASGIYLSGGPHTINASGLLPLGDYYFQVTDPSGKTLLSTDDISCRTITVQNNLNGQGVIFPNNAMVCSHPGAMSQGLPLDPNGGNPVYLPLFAQTPNNGGVYKVWVTPVSDWNQGADPSLCTIKSGAGNGSTQDTDGVCQGSFGFVSSNTKTDNFRIKCTSDCGTLPPQSTISGVKYNDLNADGVKDPTDPPLQNWQIDVAYTFNGIPLTTSIPTDAGGNWSVVADQGTSITACEVLQSGWNQSAPKVGDSPVAGITAQAIGVGLNPAYASNCWTGSVPSATTTTGLDFGNYAQLVVSKTAIPAFTRTYAWSISKAVDKTLIEQIGGTATFNYTVTASETGFTDSAWAVSGNIKVNNPNSANVTATVTDAIDDGGTCLVTDGLSATLVPGSNNFAYSCSYSSAPSPLSGTNTATATWAGGAPTGTATFDFNTTTPTSTVNKTITVKDTFNGTTTTLGTLTATDTTPYTTHDYKYSHTVNVPTNDACVSYTNTALIFETSQSSSQTVKVCGAVTGGLTMGFWQNKNGQGIITGQAKTGTCPSATWLRQFNPFLDLSSTATCAQVGTYVTGIIKAASAAGSTENPMLKAQMLATALDVYFSDLGLGGNQIGAPKPLGGVNVDLTKVCKMIDGSGGAATCTGTYENASGAFGGATAYTVSQILSYAASQSNSGGSLWYGQVKATQDLAKDVFDAINNGVALVAP